MGRHVARLPSYKIKVMWIVPKREELLHKALLCVEAARCSIKTVLKEERALTLERHGFQDQRALEQI